MSRLFRKFIKSFKYGQKGFTLIELLIVIAILGILAAVAIPQLTKFIGQSKISAANAELGLVKSAIGAGLTDAQQSTVATPGTLTSAADVVIRASSTSGSLVNVGDYIQGTKSTIVGTYTIDANGAITAATYPSGGSFTASIQKFN